MGRKGNEGAGRKWSARKRNAAADAIDRPTDSPQLVAAPLNLASQNRYDLVVLELATARRILRKQLQQLGPELARRAFRRCSVRVGLGSEILLRGGGRLPVDVSGGQGLDGALRLIGGTDDVALLRQPRAVAARFRPLMMTLLLARNARKNSMNSSSALPSAASSASPPCHDDFVEPWQPWPVSPSSCARLPGTLLVVARLLPGAESILLVRAPDSQAARDLAATQAHWLLHQAPSRLLPNDRRRPRHSHRLAGSPRKSHWTESHAGAGLQLTRP